MDKLTALIESKSKTAEDLKATVAALKSSNHEWSAKWKQECELRQQEAQQAEKELRERRQLQAKSKVTKVHQESLEKLLEDRNSEVVNLRQRLNDARKRQTSSLIPRLSIENATVESPTALIQTMTIDVSTVGDIDLASSSETEIESERYIENTERQLTAVRASTDDLGKRKRPPVAALRIPVATQSIGVPLRTVQAPTSAK